MTLASVAFHRLPGAGPFQNSTGIVTANIVPATGMGDLQGRPRSLSGPAHDNDLLSLANTRQGGGLKAGQWMQDGPGNAPAGELVGFAHIDDYGFALCQQLLQFSEREIFCRSNISLHGITVVDLCNEVSSFHRSMEKVKLPNRLFQRDFRLRTGRHRAHLRDEDPSHGQCPFYFPSRNFARLVAIF